jgi:ATP-dependent helicase/DNAse subunit B
MKEKQSKKAILTLSASRVNTYQQCPRKYYYSYVEKLPGKEWAHFDLGTLAHGVLEYFHETFKKDGDSTGLKTLMKSAFQKQRKEMEKEKELLPEILLEARNLLQEYLDNIEVQGIGSEIISLEEKFNIPLNDKYCVRGVVDRIDKDPDGIYHIKDYKTNKNKKYMKPFQLQTYGIHLLDKFPEVTRFRGSYVMLRFGGMLVPYDFNEEDVIKVKKNLIEFADKIIEEERWITKPSRLCDWCDFKGPCFSTW